MNFADYLKNSKSPQIKQKSSLEELSFLIRPMINSLQSSPILIKNAEDSLKNLEKKLSNQSPIEIKRPEEVIPLLKQHLSTVKSANTLIKSLSNVKSSSPSDLKPSRRYAKKKQLSIIKLSESPAEYEFKSRPNNIKVFILHYYPKQKPKPLPLEFEFDDENFETLSTEFMDHGLEIKPLLKRYSMQKLSESPISISEKSRFRLQTISAPPELKPILSESSSSSSSEDLNFFFEARQIYYTKKQDKSKFSEMDSEPITNKDYKNIGSKPVSFLTPQEISNGEAVKFGYLLKRMGDTNKFHKRWIVLRNFKIFWYRKPSSNIPKGVVCLGKSLVFQTEAGKEKCFAIASKERLIQFKHDETGLEWKIIINSQVSFKRYLEECKEYNIDFLEYFQDVNSSQFTLKNAEIPDGVFTNFINALPAHTKLRSLVLNNCRLTDENVISMCELIKAACGIQSLDLSENFLTSKSVFSISSLIKQEESKFNTILNLDLSGNLIGDEGVESLSRAFVVRFEQLFLPKLLHQLPFHSLKLNRIEMGDLGLNAIATIFNKVSLLLQSEDIEDKIHLGISENTFTHKSFNRFIECISQYNGIKELDISYNLGISDPEIILLTESLTGNYSLLELDLRGIAITRNGYRKIFPYIAQNYSILKIKIKVDEEFKIAVVEYGKVLKDVYEIEF